MLAAWAPGPLWAWWTAWWMRPGLPLLVYGLLFIGAAWGLRPGRLSNPDSDPAIIAGPGQIALPSACDISPINSRRYLAVRCFNGDAMAFAPCTSCVWPSQPIPNGHRTQARHQPAETGQGRRRATRSRCSTSRCQKTARRSIACSKRRPSALLRPSPAGRHSRPPRFRTAYRYRCQRLQQLLVNQYLGGKHLVWAVTPHLATIWPMRRVRRQRLLG